MSPEQARGLKVDTRTDIWSFGVMLYELLTQRLPFAGETTIDLMHSIIHKVHDPLEIIKPDLPNKLFFIVKNTLQKNIKERYQTIENVLSDLQQVKQRLDYEKIELAILPDEPKTRYQPKKRIQRSLNQNQRIIRKTYLQIIYRANSQHSSDAKRSLQKS